MTPRNPTPARLALTVEEAAASLGLSRSVMFDVLRGGDGPRVVYVGRKRLIPIRELEAWLDRQSTRP